jgi:hypothetical protein
MEEELEEIRNIGIHACERKDLERYGLGWKKWMMFALVSPEI